MKTVGIIGFGSFGKFLAEKLDPYVSVRVFSYSGKGDQWKSDLDTVAASDYLILAVPLEAYESTLNDIKDKLGSATVLVDVCSVKEHPIRVIQSVLPHQPLLATHPLFGPESAKESLVDHVLVLCPEASQTQALKTIKTFAKQLKLNVVEMSATEHDKEMAVVQGLTFFIAHALKDMNLHEQTLSTPSFTRLLHLAELEQHHSYELFNTIQTGNEYTAAIRKRFVEISKQINADVSG